MELRSLAKYGIPVVLIVVFAWSRLGDRSDTSGFAKADIIVILDELEVSSADREFLELWTDVVHSQAFQAAYDLGGKRRRSTFDVEKYLDVFFENMAQTARHWDKKELAEILQSFHHQLKGVSAGEAEE